MIVFVTGGTGALGQPTVRRLVEAGHRVRTLAHSEESVARLRDVGAEPVRGSLFDPASLRTAMAGVEAVLHLATRIPAPSAARRRHAWRENDRIRSEGTRNLVDAALTSGVRTFVYPSVVLVYPRSADRWIDATAEAPRPDSDILATTLQAEREVERFTSAGGRGIVLRMGQFYGDDRFTRQIWGAARRGVSLVLGDPDGYQSWIWTDDAAAAVAASLGESVSAGVYDVVDDNPLPRRAISAALARAVGRRRLVRLPTPLAKAALGSVAYIAETSLRVSNRRFRAASGWAPSMPSVREGFARLAETFAPGDSDAARGGGVRRARLLLGLLVVTALIVGSWAAFAPRSFYDDFPGLGRAWVSGDGPYNEHLVRDVGQLTLGAGMVAAIALVWTTAASVRAAAAGTLVSSTPHFLYHIVTLDALASTSDRVLQTASLGVAPAAAAALLWMAGGLDGRSDFGSAATRDDASADVAGASSPVSI